ncbi:MAG: CARDB domain-containing protein, partial [Bacteroidota bacterium]
HCAFHGLFAPNQSTNYALIYADGNTKNNNHNIFSDNYFFGGSCGIYLVGLGRRVAADKGILITGNKFNDQYNYGIRLSNHHSSLISNNRVSSNSTYRNYTAVALRYNFHNVEVLGNTINSNQGFGIILQQVEGKIDDKGLVANNFINIKANNSNYCFGIAITGSDHYDIYNNTVRIDNLSSDNRAFSITNTIHSRVKNNIFTCTNNGYAYYDFFNGTNEFDYNSLFSQNGILAKFNSLDISTLEEWQNSTNQAANSINALPNFLSDNDLHVKDTLINGAGTPLPEITTDIDGDPRDPNNPDIGADEFDFFKNDLGVIAILSPTDSCNLSEAERVTVVIENLGSEAQSNFQIGFQLENGTPVIETIADTTIEVGDTASYTFNAPINLSNHQTYNLTCFIKLATDQKTANDSLSVNVKNHRYPVVNDNTLPQDGATGLKVPIDFSWLPSDDANRYDLQLWKASEIPPATPIAGDIEANYYAYEQDDLLHDTTYHWQITAKNDFCATEGRVQSFTMEGLPNLQVQAMHLPFSPVLGRPVEVNWTVKNVGTASTKATQWSDFVYLSKRDTFIPEEAIYLGGFANSTSLDSQAQYTQRQMLDLPIEEQGQYYIFVVTDVFNRVEESVEQSDNVSVFELCRSIQPKENIVLNLTDNPTTTIAWSDVIEPMTTACESPTVWLKNNEFNCDLIGLNSVMLYAQNQGGSVDSVLIRLMVMDEAVNCTKCQAFDLDLSNDALSSGVYAARRNIASTGKVYQDSLVILRAGNNITLQAGFHAQKAAHFTAQIVDCEISIVGDGKQLQTAETGILLDTPATEQQSITLQTNPNPFQTSTEIQFELPEATLVNLQIYDLNGQLVENLIQGDWYEKGAHQLTFIDQLGIPTIYFVVLRTEKAQVVRKLILTR